MAEVSCAEPWFQEGDLFRESRLARLKVPHGVTLRSLGDMKDPACRARACQAAGFRGFDVWVLKQEHGTRILQAPPPSAMGISPVGDGWVSAARDVGMGVFVADCLPLFLWQEGLEAMGVFHAGWRGIAAGMPRLAVRAFRRFGLDARKLCAAIGPHVKSCCYRVGPELRQKFRPENFSEDSQGMTLNLSSEVLSQWIEAGLDPARISVSTACTACSGEHFFSYRREKLDRRMLALLALPSL